MDQNSVNLVGRLAADPKLYPNDDPKRMRVQFRLAVNRGGRKDADGKDLVDFIMVTAFGKKASAIADHTHKGKEVAVQGELHEDSRPVTLSDGTPLVHPETQKPLYNNYTEVLASRVSFGRDSQKWLQEKAGTAQGASPAPSAPAPAPQAAQATQAQLDAVTAAVIAKMQADAAASQAPAPAPAANPLGSMA